ncbi:MAG: hypothetical protein IJ678_02860, partial [Kiritimatiellae bacterium]|nr:hypothetical protein [Kiritimatiellia bacterium]
DASAVLRAPGQTRCEAWIETFRLERRADGWFFVLDATVRTTGPDGASASRRVFSPVLVASPGAPEPPPERVVAAVAESLSALSPVPGFPPPAP